MKKGGRNGFSDLKKDLLFLILSFPLFHELSPPFSLFRTSSEPRVPLLSPFFSQTKSTLSPPKEMSRILFFLALMPLPLLSFTFCLNYIFLGHCCSAGHFKDSPFQIAIEVNPTHTCMGFNTTSPSFPVMFGSWFFGTLNVRMVTGLSSGLCLENHGAPMVGFCARSLGSSGSWTLDGCPCDAIQPNITCSNQPLTEFPAKPACNVQAPTQNDYRIWSQEECQNYMASLPN